MATASFLIDRGEWGRFKNKDLASLLSQLRDLIYDAEDLLRELDDQVLRQKIEDADRSRAGQLLSSSLYLAKHLFNRTQTRVKETQDGLDKVMAQTEVVLHLLGLNVKPGQLMPETSSIISASQVFGRDSERDSVIEMLGVKIGREDERDQEIKQLVVPLTKGCRSAGSKGKKAATSQGVGVALASASGAKRLKGNTTRAVPAETNCTDIVSVLPIVGIGGVGKTTLAQLVYNDHRVRCNFGLRIWVCVSDLFDMRGITKEIVESISGKQFSQSCSLNTLQEELKEQLTSPKCRKFLLVLDDIWPNANKEWEVFYGPLRHGPEGSMIIITTRSKEVADIVTTSNCRAVLLKGLPNDIFWEFFRKCAFGKNDPESYPRLQYIGQSISSRLCGSPLAAKTLGRLLNMELTEEHWRTIHNSELWQLPHKENEILPALQLTYLYLPQELKRCFAFCSMFPKDYRFKRTEIVDIWVAEGFVSPEGNMRPEDVGIRYLDNLRSRFLLETDPNFPDKYVVHDLIHDMAKSVSVDECFSIQELCYLQNRRRMPHTVRHMSIHETHSESFRAHLVNPEQALKRIDIRHLSKLHSLRIGPRFCNEITWFNQLSNILYLNLEGCNFIKLPESIWELNSLRYLDISHCYVQELPKKFWCLYNLQVLDARSCGLHVISDITITRPMNIRVLPKIVSGALSEVSGLGNLSYLRNLSKFTVGREYGRRISELKSMNQLSGTLSVTSLYNVQSAEEAAEARLFDKQYLKKLILQWEDGRVFGQPRPGENGVIEGLRPHSRIEHLEFHDFWGDRFSTTWFRSEDLPNLRSLVLNRCLYLKSLSIPYLASLEQLELTEVGIECLTTFAAAGVQAGSTGHDRSEDLPNLRSLVLNRCLYLKSLSIPYLASLEQLELTEVGIECLTTFAAAGVQAGSTGHDRTQYASSSNSFSNGAASSFTFTRLTALYIFGCNQLKNLEQFLTPENMPSLKQMTLRNCDALVSIPVHTFVGFVCLQDLKISGCDKLTCPREMVLPPSLLRLCIAACGELDRSFPACLESLTSLTVLQLVSCHNIKYIPLIAGTKCLILCYCPELSSIGGSHGLSSIQHVDISNCPKLTEVEQPFTKKELIRAEADDLLKF
ncbi:unnamed protein product [Urochloa decumbens]|uniref:NB-ARC domain-containing protein n=1 Tax=Urochloa decumbens TaxID=240449 RepID=A0ABC9G2V9_9POAL